mmetsp:Transcript_25946/g.41086  ORF Transcript_25946/g.41086 Transcript_25946/m.41086 type:complete len:82 (-) Transcript_25946:36-281(-)
MLEGMIGLLSDITFPKETYAEIKAKTTKQNPSMLRLVTLSDKAKLQACRLRRQISRHLGGRILVIFRKQRRPFFILKSGTR